MLAVSWSPVCKSNIQYPVYGSIYCNSNPGDADDRQCGVQAESLWLHLGIIKELAAMCHSVFQGGDVRYCFTTVPTYPRLA